MNFNMITKELQLLGNSVTRLNVENSLFDCGADTEHSFGMDVIRVEKEMHEDRMNGLITVQLTVEAHDHDGNACTADMEIEGIFAAGKDVDEEHFMKLLYINGVSALIGIARGKIEAVTASVLNSGKLSVPFVNVLEYYQDVLKENE